jgi:hypothetical protein
MLYDAWSLSAAVFVLIMGIALSVYWALARGKPAGADRLNEPGNARSIAGVASLTRDSMKWKGVAGRLLLWLIRRTDERRDSRPVLQRLRKTLGYAGWSGTDKLVVFGVLQIRLFWSPRLPEV